ncbi:MAG: type II 3-dehydroquinate dehydratase [Ruminococcaceae bacterium]|nr:type II 3-dehydroquinate dehydratase [Oscillospiraceae bacterium]
MKLLIINGPNLNMLGIREPQIYGKEDYRALCAFINAAAEEVGAACEIFQSNHEGAIVDKIQESLGHFDGIVINPAAYTHTSVAIADALAAVALPTVEVHLSDINEREAFRRHSFVAPIAKKTFMGKGFEGYRLAIRFLAQAQS